MSQYATTYFNLLMQKKLYEEAFVLAVDAVSRNECQQSLCMFRLLLDQLPDALEVRYNYAMMLEKTGAKPEASNQYRLLFESAPEYAQGALGYGRILISEQGYCRAVRVLQESLRLNPDSMSLVAAYANALIFAGEPERALIYYRIIFDLAPDDRRTIANFLYTLLMVRNVPAGIVAEELECWSAVPLLFQRAVVAGRQLADLVPKQVTDFHRSVGRLLEGSQLPERPDWLKQLEDQRRLRIGYLSSDFYNHPMGYLMQGVLPNHDRSSFEIFCLSPFAERDGLAAELKKCVDHWIVVDAADRESAALLIRSLQLDILVELSGHTGDNWLDLCARRVAPIQLTWGGYPSTTGLSCIDYLIADRTSLPDDEAPFYTEKPLRLNRGYACFIPPDKAPSPTALPAQGCGTLTFGCFFTVHKLSSSTVELWSALLRALPDARLLLKAKAFGDDEVKNNCLNRFVGQGIAPERLILTGGSPRIEMMAEYGHIDIALDPLPYQGGVTILEAAWMGVPTLLLRGSRPPFIRHGENYLEQLGLGDWIADTLEEYLDKAVDFGSNLQRLAELRAGLRQQMASSSICDTVGFTRDLEEAYNHVWLTTCHQNNS